MYDPPNSKVAEAILEKGQIFPFFPGLSGGLWALKRGFWPFGLSKLFLVWDVWGVQGKRGVAAAAGSCLGRSVKWKFLLIWRILLMWCFCFSGF